MKAFWIGALACVLGVASPAMGTVLLDNTPPAVGSENARMHDEGGAFLSGPGYLAQLYAGPSPERLVGVGIIVPFLSGSLAGYFRGGQVNVPFVEDLGMVWVQVRAWEAAGGASFEEAVLGGAWTGVSTVLYIRTGGISAGVPVASAALHGLEYPGTPIIVRQPAGVRVQAGTGVDLSVAASARGRPRFQWHQGESGNTANPIKDATNAVFRTLPFATSRYWVRVYSAAGSADSATATVTVLPANAVALDLRMDGRLPVLTLDTPATGQLQVQFSSSLDAPTWHTLTNVSLTTNRFTMVDADGSDGPMRFYRGVILP